MAISIRKMQRYSHNLQILTYKAGTLDTLYQILLAEQVHNNERCYDKNTCGTLENVLIKCPYGVVTVKNLERGRRYRNVGHYPRTSRAHEEDA